VNSDGLNYDSAAPHERRTTSVVGTVSRRGVCVAGSRIAPSKPQGGPVHALARRLANQRAVVEHA